MNRIEALCDVVRTAEADAMLLTGEVNLIYATEATGLEGYCLLLADGTALFITDGRYIEAAELLLHVLLAADEGVVAVGAVEGFVADEAFLFQRAHHGEHCVVGRVALHGGHDVAGEALAHFPYGLHHLFFGLGEFFVHVGCFSLVIINLVKKRVK